MTPWQLAKDSESSQQQALFCFVAKAAQIGFELAKLPKSYQYANADFVGVPGVPELLWYHAIPNGGSRGDTARSRAIEGGRMKAEGVKPGVLDTFWPLARHDNSEGYSEVIYCGLYIELKKPALKQVNNPTNGLSDEQKAFGQFCIDQGYMCRVAYSWLEAVDILEYYFNLGK